EFREFKATGHARRDDRWKIVANHEDLLRIHRKKQASISATARSAVLPSRNGGTEPLLKLPADYVLERRPQPFEIRANRKPGIFTPIRLRRVRRAPSYRLR